MLHCPAAFLGASLPNRRNCPKIRWYLSQSKNVAVFYRLLMHILLELSQTFPDKWSDNDILDKAQVSATGGATAHTLQLLTLKQLTTKKTLSSGSFFHWSMAAFFSLGFTLVILLKLLAASYLYPYYKHVSHIPCVKTAHKSTPSTSKKAFYSLSLRVAIWRIAQLKGELPWEKDMAE